MKLSSLENSGHSDTDDLTQTIVLNESSSDESIYTQFSNQSSKKFKLKQLPKTSTMKKTKSSYSIDQLELSLNDENSEINSKQCAKSNSISIFSK